MKTLKKTFTFLLAAVSISLSGCDGKQHKDVVPVLSGHSYSVNKELPRDSAVKSIIRPYKSRMDSVMNEVLVQSSIPMVKAKPESELGNLIADLSYMTADSIYQRMTGRKIDFVILNHGGLRTSLPEGNITRRKVFELMPFDNELMVITLPAEKVITAMNYLARTGGQPVSGVQLIIGNDSISSFTIRGKTINPERNYHILTTDYLAYGGDKMNFFLEPVERTYLELKLRDAIITHFKKMNDEGDTLKSKTDKRIQYE